MRHKPKLLLLAGLLLSVAIAALLYVFTHDVAVLNPAGEIGHKQHRLLLVSSYLMLLIVIPTVILTFCISWKYRESNHKTTYRPNWDFSLLAESIWWTIPFVLMAILGVITWRACHELDPFKPIVSDKKPLTIQAVALKWKWLFIYPDLGIATVNYLPFPEKTPLHFEITSDGPMNSFWIPKLGGQIYAMAGMKSELNLIANQEGSYRGCSANLSGEGFSGMVFTAESLSEGNFDNWTRTAMISTNRLNLQSYNELAEPSQYNGQAVYRLGDGGLFDQIIMKYMTPQGTP